MQMQLIKRGIGKFLFLSMTVGLLSYGVVPKAIGADIYAPANRDFQKAMDNYTARNWDQVIFFLNGAIGSYDNDPKMYMLRGKAHFQEGHWALAMDDFNKVLQFSPNYFSAFMWRGAAHAKVGSDDLAIMDFEQAIRLNPRLAKRWFNPPGANKHQRAAVINAERYHLPGVSPEDMKSPTVHDYEAAMNRVYPDGYSASAPKRVGDVNPHTYATDADDGEYLTELAAGAAEQKHKMAAKVSPASADGTTGNDGANAQDNLTAGDDQDKTKSGKKHHPHKLSAKQSAASDGTSTDGVANGNAGASRAANAPPGSKNDTGLYVGLTANPAESRSTNVEGNLDVGRSDDTLDPHKNRRVANVFDRDPDFGEFGAVPGSQPLIGDPETVIKRCTEAMHQNNQNPEYYYWRAKAYQKLARVDDAYRDYSQAIKLNDSIPKYYIGRASMFYQLQKPLLVDADVKRALGLDQALPHEIHFGGDPYPPNVKWSGDGPGGY